MTTAAPKVTATRRARLVQRDTLANSDVPPGTGTNSTVSPEALTRAATARSGRSALSGDLAKSVNAATLPQAGPGQTRGAAAAAARPQSPSQRTPGKDGHTR